MLVATTPTRETSSKDDHQDYIRLLSRHVLALWFARCPLKQRPLYAKIVADGTHVIVLVMEIRG
jgi:hypothetical protein